MEKNWSIHVEFMVLLVTLLGGFYLLDGKIERQGERTDKIYEMYCEIRKETYTMFSETQKEIKQLHIDFILKDKKQNDA